MHTARRIVAGLGRSFISTGVLVLLFVMYELYGTSIQEARAQKKLKDKIEEVAGKAPAPDFVPQAVYVAPPPPPVGAALATIKIEKIGLFKAVVEGVDTNDLKKGPGHYAGTPLPGEAGNVAIAGHRTTYGAPFYRVNELAPGDPIVVTTKQGSFTYKVLGQKVVGPNDNYVLDPTDTNILTLTTCHPRFSAAQRLIVTAELEGAPLGVRDLSNYESVGLASERGAAPVGGGTPPAAGGTNTTAKPGGLGVIGGVTNAPENNSATVTSAPAGTGTGTGTGGRQSASIDGGVSGSGVPRGPAIQWGIISALVALLTYLAGRRWKKWPAYALGTPVFLIVLFVFFENFASLLPANV